MAVPPKIRGTPTNHLRVSKNDGGIEGQYFIDVSMSPAPQPVVSGAENVLLHTKNGIITADIWMTGNNALERVSMKLRSDNGHVYAKLVRLLLALSRSSQTKQKTHSMMSSLSVSPARPFTSIFGPHMETSPFHCPGVSAGQ